MKIESKVIIYGVATFMIISVGVLSPDYSLENPPENKLCYNGIKVNSITSSTSAFVQS